MHAYSFSFVVTAPTRKAKKRRGEPSAKLRAHLRIQEEEQLARFANFALKSTLAFLNKFISFHQ